MGLKMEHFIISRKMENGPSAPRGSPSSALGFFFKGTFAKRQQPLCPELPLRIEFQAKFKLKFFSYIGDTQCAFSLEICVCVYVCAYMCACGGLSVCHCLACEFQTPCSLQALFQNMPLWTQPNVFMNIPCSMLKSSICK